MKNIVCQRDGKECDLNKPRRSCRHIDGTWAGKCGDRLQAEVKRNELVRSRREGDR